MHNTGNFQANSVDSYDHSRQTHPMHLPNHQTPNEEAYSTDFRAQNNYPGYDSAYTSHSSVPWDAANTENYNPAAESLGSQAGSDVMKASTQAQPDLVSATSSSTGPSNFKSLPPTSYGGASSNIPTHNVQQGRDMASGETSNQIGSINSIQSEIQNVAAPMFSNGMHSQYQNPPESLPPLPTSYPPSVEPPTTTLNKGGYGLGPDVITAVSSANITNASHLGSPSTDHPIHQQETQEDAEKLVLNAAESAAAEQPLWESGVVEEEANQITSKLASRIDEMRKAKEVSGSIPQENSNDRNIDNFRTGSNLSQQASGASDLNSNLQQHTESSQDTSPEHRTLQHQQGSVAIGSHAEHYAYYQQFENLSVERIGNATQSDTQSVPVYNRTPDVIAPQQPLPSPGLPPSSDRNLYMQTGHLNEQDDVLNHPASAYPVEPERPENSSNMQTIFGQPSIHRPTTVPDGGNEIPMIASNPPRSTHSQIRDFPVEQDHEIPLDRLVLGESETASNQQQQYAVAAQAPYMSQQTALDDAPNINWNVWNNGQVNRFVTGEDDRRVPGASSNDDRGSIVTAPPITTQQQSSSIPPVRYKTLPL